MKKVDAATPVKSISRAAAVLRCLSKNANSVKDIAEACVLSMATVHRILQTLEAEGLAFQNPLDHKYYLGPLFTQLPLDQAVAHRYLTTKASDAVSLLWDLFGEFLAVDVEVGIQAISLIEKQSRFNYSIRRLSNTSLYYGSLSKVFMAQKSDAEIELILDSIAPKPSTVYGAADKASLLREFRQVREQGYSVSRRELTEGIMGITVPISNYICPAALSMVGPEIRLDPITSRAIEEMLVSAKRISASIALDKHVPSII